MFVFLLNKWLHFPSQEYIELINNSFLSKSTPRKKILSPGTHPSQRPWTDYLKSSSLTDPWERPRIDTPLAIHTLAKTSTGELSSRKIMWNERRKKGREEEGEEGGKKGRREGGRQAGIRRKEMLWALCFPGSCDITHLTRCSIHSFVHQFLCI